VADPEVSTIDEWTLWDRRRQEDAWWSAWCSLWQCIVTEEVRVHETCSIDAVDVVDQGDNWWKAWSSTWSQIGSQLLVTWWAAWDFQWKAICAEHARPFVWHRSWVSVWEKLGDQYAVQEAAMERALTEVAEHEKARRRAWWPGWIRVWSDIGKRESGVMAAWKPICRNCRGDLKQATV